MTEDYININPNETLNFDYSTTFSSRINKGFNTATVTVLALNGQELTFNSDSIPINFNQATITEIDSCINVVDSSKGLLTSEPHCQTYKTFSYIENLGPFNVCCENIPPIKNTATFTTLTTGTTGSSSWIITISPCKIIVPPS